MHVDNSLLSSISEIQAYINTEIFWNGYINSSDKINNFSDPELDMLAYIRCLEITNGCVQYAYRSNTQYKLPYEVTRKCMELCMNAMKSGLIPTGNLSFNLKSYPQLFDYTQLVRKLYIKAFKTGTTEERFDSSSEFYGHLVNQLLTFEYRNKLKPAMQLFENSYGYLFTSSFIEMAKSYMVKYTNCLILHKPI